ncbi:hypothetical protein ASG59_18725 [Methylobacterium sp. Leaf466]|nr:hypothetical protein ASG59_18725 [Methylobacterium sp. Leaf466]
MSTERQKVMEYIDGVLPKRQHAGSFSGTTRECYNAVEMMRAQLGDTFSVGSGIVQFDAKNVQDTEAAYIATEYTNHVFYRKNGGERIIRDVIFDGLTARVGIAKVWWDKDVEEVELEFDNITAAELDYWKQADDITDIVLTDEYEDGTASGKIVRVVDKGQVLIEVVNPEEFFIESHAKHLSDEYFCGQRTRKTIDWIVTNYPKMKGREDDLAAGVADDQWSSPEVIARFSSTSESIRLDDDPIQDELREVMVVEVYTRLKRKGDLTARLYKIIRCGSVTIEIEPVESNPYVCFTALPRPHRFYGENFVNTVVPIQTAKTALLRSMIDAAMLTSNPRYQVVKGGLLNPSELLENRLSGIVNVRDKESVFPLPQPQMNPMLMTLMQGLDAMNEGTTGISALSQGLNKDAISKSSSAAQLEQQTGVSQTRQKEIARCFVNGFLIPLFCKIYDLVVAHEKRENIELATATGWAKVSPMQWSAGRTASASAHLGYGEKDNEANRLMMIGKEMASNPIASAFAGPAGAYSILADILTLQGHRADIKRYLPVTPDMLPPPQPSPMEQAEMALVQAKAQAEVLNAQTAAKKVEEHGEIARMKVEMAKMSAMMNAMMKSRDADRKDAESANRIEVSQTETALLVDAAATGTDPAKAIISPNS